jgi:predicted nucleic acid-binding Zn ribbon protein
MDPESQKTCPDCGAALHAGSKFCSQCGQVLDPTARPQQPTRAKWYYNVWFVLAMLLFVLGPLGLPLVWKNPHFGRWVKVVLTIAMVAYTVVLVDLTIRAFQAAMAHVNQLVF